MSRVEIKFFSSVQLFVFRYILLVSRPSFHAHARSSVDDRSLYQTPQTTAYKPWAYATS